MLLQLLFSIRVWGIYNCLYPITLFKSITYSLCGTNNIPQNFPKYSPHSNYCQSNRTLLWIWIMLCHNICELYLLCWLNPSFPSVTKRYLFKSCHQVHLAASIFMNNKPLSTVHVKETGNLSPFIPFNFMKFYRVNLESPHESWHSFSTFLIRHGQLSTHRTWTSCTYIVHVVPYIFQPIAFNIFYTSTKSFWIHGPLHT